MQLLEANGNLTRMLEFFTLTDDDRRLVEQGIGINQALIDKIADEPTPAGPTLRQLAARRGKHLPVVTETAVPVEATGQARQTKPPLVGKRRLCVWRRGMPSLRGTPSQSE